LPASVNQKKNPLTSLLSPSTGPVNPSTHRRHRRCLHPNRIACTIGFGLPPMDLDSYHRICPPSTGSGRTLGRSQSYPCRSTQSAATRARGSCLEPVGARGAHFRTSLLERTVAALWTSPPKCAPSIVRACGRPPQGLGPRIPQCLYRQSSKGTARRAEERCAGAQRERGRERLRAESVARREEVRRSGPSRREGRGREVCRSGLCLSGMRKKTE
jgi:hypothetical protein